MNFWIGMLWAFPAPAAITGNIHHIWTENTWKYTLQGIFSEKRQQYIVFVLDRQSKAFDVLFQL